MTASPLPVVMIAGPTGVGKTELSLALVKFLTSEIINADSMQVYRYLDIGTAKPSRNQRLATPHHLLDIVDPDEDFDAARYAAMARPIVDALHDLGKIPLVVGGTGLYMKSLVHGLCPGAPADAIVRRNLIQELEAHGQSHLYRQLQGCDPVLSRRIHPNDRQRILRALEVYRITGKPLSAWQAEHRFRQTRYRAIKIVLFRDREELYKRINQRVHEMMDQGFLNEVKALLDMGYRVHLKPLQSLGYKQLIQHLAGDLSLDEAIRETQKQSRRYAKRQLTWFRGDKEYHWFHADDIDRIISWVQIQLGEISKFFPSQNRLPPTAYIPP